MYNHHQTGPAGAVIFVPPFRDPFNYYFDPLVPLGIDLVGTAMHSRFVAEGKGGSAMRSGASYSTWWNGGLRTDDLLPQHDRHPDRDHRQPHADGHPAVADKQLPTGDWPLPIAPQKWHFRQSIDYEITHNRAILDWPRATARRSCSTSSAWAGTPSSRAAGTPGPSRPSASKRCRRPRRSSPRRTDARGRRRRRRDERPRRRWRTRRAAGRALRQGAARSRQARPARLHHPVRPARLPDRDQVRQRAAQDRHHDPSGHGSLPGGGQELSRPDPTW